MRRGRRTGCSSFRKSSNNIMDLTALSIADLQARMRAKEVSPAETLAALEARIAKVDPLIHGYLSRDLAAAQRMAEAADVSLPLGGVPVAIKDVINVKGEPCTCGSQILRGYTAKYDATVIARLRAAVIGDMNAASGLRAARFGNVNHALIGHAVWHEACCERALIELLKVAARHCRARIERSIDVLQ